MRMRKGLCLFIAGISAFICVLAFSEGLLPDLEDVYGVEVPSFTDIVGRFPDSVQETEKGISMIYSNVSDEHYYAFGKALEAAGCEVKDYAVNGKTITVTISCKGKTFSFSYDSDMNTMTVVFPDGIVDNPQMTPTPTPAPTPTPTPVPTETPQPVVWDENAGYSIDLGEQAEYDVFIGQTRQISFVIKSLDEKKHNGINVVWETSDKNIATVNNKGQITGIAAGDAVISCRSKKDKTVYSLAFIHVKPIVGTVVRFGRYEQDDNLENGPEEIEWIVLDFDGKKNSALLLSKYGLDVQRYHKTSGDITWEQCSLRTWLNNEFYNAAFDLNEQKAVLSVRVDNSVKQGFSKWKSKGGKNTEDKVFLLSYAEANRYLGVTIDDRNNIGSRVAPTAYAVARKATINESKLTADGEAAGRWWLRSPGRLQYSAADVNSGGSLGDSVVDYDHNVVRPAFWLNLESGIF